MSDQPTERSLFWRIALAAPPVIIGVGSLLAISAPRSESDWLGLEFLLGIFASVVLAMVVTVIAGTISFLRREPKAAACKITYLPSILLLILGMPLFWEMYQRKQARRHAALEYRQQKEQRVQLIKRLVKDEAFRHAFLQNSSLTPVEMEAIMTEEVIQHLNEREILGLWNKRSLDANFRSYLLIDNTNAPSIVLREYYSEILERGAKLKGGFKPRALATNHKTLLLHPNLPADLIAEIHDFHEPDVDELLMKNPQFKTGSSKPAKP